MGENISFATSPFDSNCAHDIQQSLEDTLLSDMVSQDKGTLNGLLYVNGININHTKPKCKTIVCPSLGCEEFVELLNIKGADNNNSHEMLPPLVALCGSTNKDEDQLLKCLDYLLSKGAHIDQCDSSGVPILSLAVKHNHEKLIIKLINEGADVNKIDQDGWSPIFYAVEEGNLFLVSLLIDYKADIYLTDRRGRTLVDIAMELEKVDIIELLNEGHDFEKWFNRTLKPEKQALTIYERMFSELPKKDDRLSGFNTDVLGILNSQQLKHLVKEFDEKHIGLGDFISIDDNRLLKMGIRFWFERKKILYAIEKFHSYPWSSNSFNFRRGNPSPDVLFAQTMATATRQIYLISVSTYWWARYGNNNVNMKMKTVGESDIRTSLSTVESLQRKLKSFRRSIKLMEKKHFSPSDLISSQNNSKLDIKKTLVLITLGAFLIFKFSSYK